jgi:hypothetical protein
MKGSGGRQLSRVVDELTERQNPTPPGPDLLLIDAKAARVVLCMGERTLWVLSNRRAVPSYKIGKSRRYCPDELRAWVRAGCPTEAGAGDRVRKGVNQ